MADIELKAYLTEIDGLLEAEKNDEAVAHCRHILDYFPRNLDVYRLLGKGLLELGRLEDAADIFYRVLSAAPDDFVAHVGMAIIGEEEGDLNKAIGHMERACEAQSNNSAIHSELKRLYGRRDGVEPAKIRLTRGALARLYLRGGNYSQAVGELKAALHTAPNRIDWQVLLAQVLWQDEQRIDAVEACQDVLERLPDCIQANSILYEIWHSAGREEEAITFWQRVESLDPYLAHEIRVPSGETRPPDLQIPRLDYVAPTPDEVMGVPDWVRDLGLGDENQLPSEADALVFGERMAALEPELSAGLDEEGEVLPDWLRNMASADGSKSGAEPGWDELVAGKQVAPGLPEASGRGEIEPDEPIIVFDSEEKSVSASDSGSDEELPEWLAEAVEWGEGQADAIEHGEDEVAASDWLAELSGESAAPADAHDELDAIPDWLQVTQEEETASDETHIAGKPAELPSISELAADVPDWLLAAQEEEPPMGEGGGMKEATEPTGIPEPGEDLPDWLAVAQDAEIPAGDEAATQGFAEPETVPETSEDLPDWLLAIQDDETAVPTHGEEQGDDQPADADQIGAEVSPPPFDAKVGEPAGLEEGEPPDLSAEGDVSSTLEKREESAMVPSDQELEEPEDQDLESLLSDPDDALAWLEKLAADQGAPLEELPSLQDQDEPRPVPTEGVPDWRKESADETLILSAQPAELPTVQAAPEVEPARSEAFDDLPDWLKELDAEPAAPPPPITPGTLSEGDELGVPDWLKGELSEGEPEELDAELAAMGVDVSEMPAERDEAVAWLEQLAASQEDQLHDYASIESGLGLEEPELPDWLSEPSAEAVPDAKADSLLDEQPESEEGPVAAGDDLDAMGEMPEDVDEAMAWLEQLAAAQGAPLEELPTMSDTASAEPQLPPSWLDAELAPDELETALLSEESFAQPVQGELGELAETLDEPELPDWLREPLEPAGEARETVTPELTVLEEPELPEWLREAGESVDEKVEAGLAESLDLEETELPEWLRESAETTDEAGETLEEPELPEWLREPAELPTAEAELDATLEEPEPAELQTGVEEPVEAEPEAVLQEPELPEWLSEPAEPPAEEPEPAAAEPAAVIEEPELPEWLREPAELVEEMEPSELEPSPVVEVEPEVDLVEPDLVQAFEAEPSAVEPSEPVSDVFVLRGQVDADPDAHTVRLSLARALLDDEMLNEALTEYGELVGAGQELDSVAADLERALESNPTNSVARRVLGDAYLKQNKLSEALDAYRRALGSL